MLIKNKINISQENPTWYLVLRTVSQVLILDTKY